MLRHLGNLWQCYYEDSATAAAEVVELYNVQLAKLVERACPSENLIYRYYESIAYNKVKRRMWSIFPYDSFLTLLHS